MNIIPLVDDENEPLNFIIDIPFQSPPNFDSYGRGGPNSHFVEEFMEQINRKHLEGVVLNNFIQRDLIITLEFSDGSEVVFDRFYMEVRENLDDFLRVIREDEIRKFLADLHCRRLRFLDTLYDFGIIR